MVCLGMELKSGFIRFWLTDIADIALASSSGLYIDITASGRFGGIQSPLLIINKVSYCMSLRSMWHVVISLLGGGLEAYKPLVN